MLLMCSRACVLQMGGMGFVHYNNSIEDQCQHVMRVKRHRPGYDVKPMVLPPTATIMQLDLLRVSLFCAAPYP